MNTRLAMSVAQSSRDYKNTKCLAALLENDEAFVTASYPSTPTPALFKGQVLSGLAAVVMILTGWKMIAPAAVWGAEMGETIPVPALEDSIATGFCPSTPPEWEKAHPDFIAAM